MAKYVQAPVNTGKAQWIKDNVPGTHEIDWCVTLADVEGLHAENAVTVCVVENGMFDAAAVCDNQYELDAFNAPTDYRPRTWLSVPRAGIAPLVVPPFDQSPT